MSDRYIPSTEEILDGYRAMRAREIPGERWAASLQASLEAASWLADHDRAVAEQARAGRRASSCNRPPRGWYCFQPRDHGGPCPTYPRWWNVAARISMMVRGHL